MLILSLAACKCCLACKIFEGDAGTDLYPEIIEGQTAVAQESSQTEKPKEGLPGLIIQELKAMAFPVPSLLKLC